MARMDALLEQALELAREGREQWLESLSPDDRDLEPALRRALLGDAYHIETLPKLTEPAVLKAGDLIGPYRLMKPLGSGGMAQVWLAQRADGAFQREVALKLPMLSSLRQDLESRFERETQILARLEHPNIARLYDAGVTAEGLPYLAMEFVAGEPLAAWCDRHHQGIRERLRLVLQVLEAVQYAHGRLVIHRDLKPSNILVTEAGQVRLLDFGVAKLLAGDGEDEQRTQLTEVYGRALTPDYASPEQLRGDSVDNASDIYSLGVVLYELLAGSRPYRLKAEGSIARMELNPAAAQVERRPSEQLAAGAGAVRGVTQKQLARRLSGDLDAIVMKALAADPAERYASAAGLAADLQRYLADQPVQARPDRITYRFGKFVLRHRAGTAAAVAAAALATAALQYAATPSPRSELPAAALPAAAPDRSIAVLPFVDMSEKKDQEYFSDGLSEELIDHLSHSSDLRVIARTSSFQFKGKNEDVRMIASKLGVAHLLEGSVRKSGKELRITAQLIKAADGSHLWSQTYDRNLDDIFKVQDEIAAMVAQELKVALAASQRASNPPVNTEAYGWVLQGNFYHATYSREGMARAVEAYRQAIKIDPNYALAWARLGSAYYNQAANGWMPSSDGIAKARQALQRALRIDPKLVWAHYTLAGMHMSVDWDWRAAKSEIDSIREAEPDNRRQLAMAAADLASIFGRLDEAIDTYRKLVDSNPLDADTMSILALMLFNANRLQESAALSRRALQLSPNLASGSSQLGVTLLYLGENDAALRAIKSESDDIFRNCALSIAYWAAGRRAEADEVLHELERKRSDIAAYNIAQVHAYRGDVDAAFQWLDRAYRQRDSAMSEIASDRLLESLRQDSRFQAMLARMKLTGAPSRLV